ncbi:TPA: hypothetical protein DEG21_06030 [Patescibacteria group bacterium]|nr:hypothetical protein [Candidatus Gracilibacteria bacterium]
MSNLLFNNAHKFSSGLTYFRKLSYTFGSHLNLLSDLFQISFHIISFSERIELLISLNNGSFTNFVQVHLVEII